MTASRNRVARFARLAGGKNSTVSVGTSSVDLVLEPNAVAFNLANASENAVFVRSDGVAPTTSNGWPVPTETQTGWVDCVGGLTLKLIADAASSAVAVWQILDEDLA